MHHVAILQKKGTFLKKIKAGQKTIESRWYKTRRTPWNNITKGDTIYFKESGKNITIKAKVKEVKQQTLSENTRDKEKQIKQILDRYGQEICLPNTSQQIAQFSNKNYCILIFLEKIISIKKLQIDKTGFGNQAAWITIKNIDKIVLKGKGK